MDSIDKLILVSKVLYNERNKQLGEANKTLKKELIEQSIANYWLYIWTDKRNTSTVSIVNAKNNCEAIDKIAETPLAVELFEIYCEILTNQGETEFPSETDFVENMIDAGQLKIYPLDHLKDKSIVINDGGYFHLSSNETVGKVFEFGFFEYSFPDLDI